MRLFALILIVLISVENAISSDPSVKSDSLRKALDSTPGNDYAARTLILRQLYDLFLVNDLPAAMSGANMQAAIARKTGDSRVRTEADSWKGNIYYNQGKNDSSLFFFNLALAGLKEAPDRKKEAEIMNNIANIFRITARYDTAMTIYVGLLKYYETEADSAKQGKLLGNIGSLYYTAGNFDKAKEYTLKALDIQRKTTDKRATAVSLINLTVFALNAENYQDSI